MPGYQFYQTSHHPSLFHRHLVAGYNLDVIYQHLQQFINMIHLFFYSYLICTWEKQVFYGATLSYQSAIDFSSSLSESLLFVQQPFHCHLSGSCKSFLTIIWNSCFFLLCSIHLEHVLSSGTLRISLPWSLVIKFCSSLIIIDWYLNITFWFILSVAESRRLKSSNLPQVTFC